MMMMLLLVSVLVVVVVMMMMMMMMTMMMTTTTTTMMMMMMMTMVMMMTRMRMVWQTERLTDIRLDRQTNGQTNGDGRQIDRQSDMHVSRLQTGRGNSEGYVRGTVYASSYLGVFLIPASEPAKRRKCRKETASKQRSTLVRPKPSSTSSPLPVERQTIAINEDMMMTTSTVGVSLEPVRTV